jgi:hypothetical protein
VSPGEDCCLEYARRGVSDESVSRFKRVALCGEPQSGSSDPGARITMGLGAA